MFRRVTVSASVLEASERFYATVLHAIGLEPDDFALTAAADAADVTRRLHIAFFAPSREHVDEFWRAGTSAGYRDDGAPGPRPQYSPDYYGAFLLDPDGNSAEAVHHGRRHRGIDHLWIRVADLEASMHFYDAVAPATGFRFNAEGPGRRTFAGADGSFTLVAGDEPTENAHMSFPARAERDATFVLDPDGNTVEVV